MVDANKQKETSEEKSKEKKSGVFENVYDLTELTANVVEFTSDLL